MKYISALNLFEGEGFTGFGPLGLENKNATEAPKLFTKFLSSTIGLITIIAIIWLLINFVTGAIAIMSAGGDKNSLESAKKKISSSVIGFVVLIASLFIIKLIGSLIGIPDILNIEFSLMKL